MRSVFIESRQWFDKTYGNSYFSNRVWIDGKVAFVTGIAYGYDTQYIWDALSELYNRGYTNDSYSLHGLRKSGVDVYASYTYGKKSELFQPED
jgi:hypothetical protein